MTSQSEKSHPDLVRSLIHILTPLLEVYLGPHQTFMMKLLCKNK